MQIDDLPFEKLKALLKDDHERFSLQLRLAGLNLVVYEFLKTTIEDRVKDFFSDGFKIVDDILVGVPSSEYKSLVKGKGVFRACRDFHLEMNAISVDDDKLIDRLVSHRNDVAHELFEYLLDDKKGEVDAALIFEAMALSKKIDNWWIVNVEFAADPEIKWDEIVPEEAISSKYLFLAQLVRVAFKDLFEQIDALNE